jgi:hypothetical protein
MKRFNIVFAVIIFLSINDIWPQEIKENWLPVLINDEKSIYINVTGLFSNDGEEIDVWTLQELNSSINIEEITGDISQIKINYLISKSLYRYSIKEMIFYDEKKNVLKSYRYKNSIGEAEYKYNYPILEKSELESIYNKCIEILSKKEN